MLRFGGVRILFMPGERVIEYQLAAQQMRSERFVAMAALEAYGQGGYETSEVSRVGPEAEWVLMEGMRKLLTS